MLVFSILTFGIYTVVWFYSINRELASVTGRPWPVKARVRDLAILVVASLAVAATALALNDGAFLMLSAVLGIAGTIVLVIIEFRTCEAVERAQPRQRGGRTGAVPLFLVLLLLPVVGIPWIQSTINRSRV